jgi:hypothetical protein
MHAVAAVKKWMAARRIRVFAALACLSFACTVLATTKKKCWPQMSYFTNTTFKFMLSIKSDEVIDPTGRRFWISRWPSNPKSIAGVNISIAHRQVTISLLRWSWKEPNQSLEPTRTSVTPRAVARVAPAVRVAHL